MIAFTALATVESARRMFAMWVQGTIRREPVRRWAANRRLSLFHRQATRLLCNDLTGTAEQCDIEMRTFGQNRRAC